jgi:cell division protease FtsH
MDRVVDVLIEKESLDGEEFRAIVGEFTTIPEKERFSPLLGDPADSRASDTETAKPQPEPAQA